jgi:hypothetical protein
LAQSPWEVTGDTGIGEFGDDRISDCEIHNGGTGRDTIDGKSDGESVPVDGCGEPSMGGGSFNGELDEWETIFAETSTEFQYLRKAFFFQLGRDNYRRLANDGSTCGCQSGPDAVFAQLANASEESRTRALSRLALSRVEREELLMILDIAAARRQ